MNSFRNIFARLDFMGCLRLGVPFLASRATQQQDDNVNQSSMDERVEAPMENESGCSITEARDEALKEDINGDQARIRDYQRLNKDAVASKANNDEPMEEHPVVQEERRNKQVLDDLADLFGNWKPEGCAQGQKRAQEDLSKEDGVLQQVPERPLREPKRRCCQRQRAPPPPPPPELVPDFEVPEPPPRERKRARHRCQKVLRPSQRPLNLESLIPGHLWCGEINLANDNWPLKWSSTRRASDIYYDAPTVDYDSGNWPDNPRLCRLIQEARAEQARELAHVVDAWMSELVPELAQEPIALGDVEMVNRGVEEQVQDMLHAQVLREQDEWEGRMRVELDGVDRIMTDAGEAGRPWDSQLRAENALWVWKGRNE